MIPLSGADMRDLLMIAIALITVKETSCMRSNSQQQWPQQQQAYWGSQGGNQAQFVNSCYDCPRYTLCVAYYGRPYCYIPTPSPLPPQRCLQYPPQGRCGGQAYRYYYDMRSRRCQMFFYTGCGGDQNNFYTYQDCQRVCEYSGQAINQNAMVAETVSSNPTMGGSLSTNIIPGSVDDQVGASVKNHHGTVVQEQRVVAVKAQNEANGHSETSGQSNPGPSYTVDTTNIPARCLLPMDKGTCSYNVFFRYHYDPSTNTCKRFQYSDCGGNRNRFFTLNSCRKTCVQPSP